MIPFQKLNLNVKHLRGVTAHREGLDEVPSSCVLFHDFGQGFGRRAVDRTVYRNKASLSSVQWSRGRFGTCLKFDGINDYVTVPHASNIDFQTYFWMEMLVEPLEEFSSGDTHGFWSKRSGTTIAPSLHFEGTPEIVLWIETTSYKAVTTGTITLKEKRLYHIVATAKHNDKTKNFIYVNNRQYQNNNTYRFFEHPTTPGYIGRHGGASSHYLHAKVYLVRLWDRLPTRHEVSNSYRRLLYYMNEWGYLLI